MSLKVLHAGNLVNRVGTTRVGGLLVLKKAVFVAVEISFDFKTTWFVQMSARKTDCECKFDGDHIEEILYRRCLRLSGFADSGVENNISTHPRILSWSLYLSYPFVVGCRAET